MGLVTEEGSKAGRWIFFGLGFVIFFVVVINALSDFSFIEGYSFADLGPHLAIAIVILVLIGYVIFGPDKKKGRGWEDSI